MKTLVNDSILNCNYDNYYNLKICMYTCTTEVTEQRL